MQCGLIALCFILLASLSLSLPVEQSEYDESECGFCVVNNFMFLTSICSYIIILLANLLQLSNGIPSLAKLHLAMFNFVECYKLSLKRCLK